MTTSKEPSKDGAPRNRGRPAERLALTEEQALGALDRMLGKKSAVPTRPPAAEAPRVRSKKKDEAGR